MTAIQIGSNTRFFTISTAGHVDHGKTSLIKALTGIDPDRLKEEKERQMTTDLGFAHLQLKDNLVVGFVDVPGHGKFLKNMLAGVGGIDMALLVVAADEGPMPQTTQHVRILSLLGVSKALVALTKIDMVADAEQIEIVRLDIQNLLDKHGIECLGICDVSSTRRTGLDELKEQLSRIVAAAPPRDDSGGAFLPVDRVFSKSGFGTVITGTLVRGRLTSGDQVSIGPNVSAGRVRKLETFGHAVDLAMPGQRVACNLVLKDNHQIVRGNVVLTGTVQPVKNLFVSLVDRPKLISGKLSDRLSDQPIRLYHGTAECHGFIRWVQELDRQSEQTQESSASQTIGIGMINLVDPVLAQPQDRFVVRLSDETIYGGTVLLYEKQRWLKREMLPQLARHLLGNNFKAAIQTYINCAPNKIVNLKQFASFVPNQSAELWQEMLKDGDIVKLDENVTLPEMRIELTQRLVNAATQLLKGVEEDGASLESLRSKLSPKLDRATFQALVDEDVAKGKLIRKGDKILLPGLEKTKTTDAATSSLQEKIVQAAQSNFCLDLADLAALCGSDTSKIKQAAQMLSKEGRTNFIAYEFVISDQNLLRAHAVLEKIWNAKRNIAPGDFREELNTTRKYAMALLQHFDDQKVTRRLQNGRVLLKPLPKK